MTSLWGSQRRRLRADLPEALFLLAGGLRAGSPLPNLLAEVGTSLGGPLGDELRRTAQIIGLGTSVPSALLEMAERTREPAVQAMAVATQVAMEVGGNLPVVFERLGRTLLEDDNLTRLARAYAVEGRVSANIIAMIPVGVLGLTSVINPGYFDPLLASGSGRLFLLGCFGAIGLGWWLTLRIAQVR